MSVELVVYLRRAAMPTPARWQQAVRDAGYSVELETDFDVDTSTGYRPCKFRGEDAGFEYYSFTMNQEDRAKAGAPPDADFAVTLVTHSDLREFATSSVAGGVLCLVSGGLLVETESGESFSSGRVLEWVSEQLSRSTKVF
jgi:hypothetical protein